MDKVYQGQVNDSWINADGLGWYVTFATPRTVDGQPMVQMNHGIFPADGWHAERADAVRDVADRLEQLGHRLLAQAARVRAEATTEVAS
jgi:hypothetical protein